ncbi:VOC family protein [Paeniglutamicibacter sp. MACA_103]|uniref:VOC family protein n=1 Tax=Paeniglutamicibacter sp. MACA_103 TaxID=3377337 RepID=UPI003893C3AA
MKTQGVVLSLAVADAGRSLAFYRDVVGIESAKLAMGTVCLELPGMTIFLAEAEAFTKYSREAKRTPLLPVPATDAFLSCAIATVAEVDEILAAVSGSTGKGFAPHEIEHASGRLQYIGTFADPDGHLWQLVCNLTDGRVGVA